MITRRLFCLSGLIAAPMIVRPWLLMPIRPVLLQKSSLVEREPLLVVEGTPLRQAILRAINELRREGTGPTERWLEAHRIPDEDQWITEERLMGVA